MPWSPFKPGVGGTFVMQVTSFRATGSAAQMTATESITVGGISFTAEMNGHVRPAGFIVLNGTVTEGPFAGARSTSEATLWAPPGRRHRGPESFSSCRRVPEVDHTKR